MVKSVRTGRRQYGVLPLRATDRHRFEILLITSRDTGRWVIPRGWPMKRRTPQETALTEAYEEAGLRGRIVYRPKVGTYRYQKLLPSGLRTGLKVDVFLMHVDEQLDEWPEKAERETRWFAPQDAAPLVAEPGLARVIRRLPRLLRSAKVRAALSPTGATGGSSP